MVAAENMNIDFSVCGAEELNFPPQTFDVVTACQCFMYFDYEIITPLLKKVLKPDGKFVILYMAWKNENLSRCRCISVGKRYCKMGD